MTITPTLRQQLAAEFVGTCLLVATIVGSGIMGDRLAAGNDAIALMANTVATAAMLAVLITMLRPVSGAHLNPAVTAAFLVKGDIRAGRAAWFAAAQFSGALLGAVASHAMFDLPLLQQSTKLREGLPQGFSEWFASTGLVMTILLTLRTSPRSLPTSVALYITAAYWFTASTSFANPAATLARAFSDTFSGISLSSVPLFMAAQLLGALSALGLARLLTCCQDLGVSPEKKAAQS